MPAERFHYDGAMKRGYLGLGVLRLHWSVPFGVIAFSGFVLEPVRWLGVAGLLLVHALGHAAAARLVGVRPGAWELTGIGGQCAVGEPTPLRGAVIAWGGIVAQLVVLAVTELVGGVRPDLRWVATVGNAWLIAVNLIPMAPFDGADAWQLPYLLGQRARQRLTRVEEPVHLVADADDPVGPHAEEAKRLAAQLLKDAAEP